jgi:hypothetical protein
MIQLTAIRNCFLLSIYMLLSFSAIAQTDSTEAKLRHYSGLYKQGLIDSAEYSQLKKSILFKNEHEPRKEKTLAELKSKSRGKLIAGPVLMALGGAFMGVGVVFPFPNVADANRGLNRGFLIGTGVISMTVGAVLLATGIVQRVVYVNRKELTAGLLQSGNVGLNLNF